MYKPKISIVTVSYNQAQFLEQTILSVLNQNYPNLEYIIIDGGSTDGSVDIIKRYADRLTYWVSEPDGGQTDGLIKGFRRASGDIQCWVNSDDMLETGALNEVADFFKNHPDARVVTGDAVLIDEDGTFVGIQRQIKFYRFLWFNTHNYISQSSTFWRSDLYKEVGGLNPGFDLAMDGDLFIRFADVSKLYHVNNLWSKFRIYSNQKTSRSKEKGIVENEMIRHRYFPNESPLARKAKHIIAKVIRIGLKFIAGCYRDNNGRC